MLILEKEMATHSSIRLGNLMDRRAWWAIVHEVAKSQTRRSDRTHTNVDIWQKLVQYCKAIILQLSIFKKKNKIKKYNKSSCIFSVFNIIHLFQFKVNSCFFLLKNDILLSSYSFKNYPKYML